MGFFNLLTSVASSEKSLEDGAIAGIVIAVVLILLVVVVLTIVYFRRREKSKNAKSPDR